MHTQYTNNPNGYAERRNFISPLEGKVEFKRHRDFFQLLLSLWFKLTGKGYQPLFKGLFYNPFVDKNDEFHFFNTILIGKNKWQVTFETTLPRLGTAPKWLYKLAAKQLARPNCIRILALSQCAYDLQVKYLRNYWPRDAGKIINKMVVKHPYQPVLIEKYEDKPLDDSKIIFTMTGADFFRKGGGEVLKVFDNLIPEYPQLHLNIISSLNYGDYATHTTHEDKELAKQVIAKYPDNITHYSYLPNHKVLEIYKASHIGLLPTWADSYGYSVLEAQAAGCPCITTNIRAMPEINNDRIGWILDIKNVKYDKNGRESMIVQLQTIIEQVIANGKDDIKNKGIRAIERIKKDHRYG